MKKLLASGAKADAPIGDKASALNAVFEILIDKGPWKAGDPPVLILYMMTQSIRHRDRKIIEVSGTLKPKLLNDARNVGFVIDGYELTESNGTVHTVAISGDETKFTRVEHSQNQFPVKFKVSYTIKGVVIKGKLEAEEISAPVQATGSESNEGMVVPLGTMLPSTMDLYRPILKEKGYVK